MKKHRLLFLSAVGFILLLLTSCTKINESTDVGSNLIPAVDNITTFETYLKTDSSKYFIDNSDTTKFQFSDYAAIGKMNDPTFGTTTGNAYFNVSSPVYGIYPFVDKNTLIIDSVVLSLSYVSGYGDTANASQTVQVFEIAQNSGFNGDTLFPYTHPDFTTIGSSLGTKTFFPKSLSQDSITLITNKKRDTAKVINVLRIPLTTTFGSRLAGYDTTSTSPNGGFATDSIFKTLFKGFAIKATSFTGNGSLSYFNLSDQTATSLVVYFRATIGGVADSASTVSFAHVVNGQANTITRQNAGEYATYAAAGKSPDGRLFIQSTPGSYATFKIPGLDTMKNKVIHRAELIVDRIKDPFADIFTPPARLFLDRFVKGGPADTAYIFQNDILIGSTGTYDLTQFGGTLNTDDSYHFNITRYVQGIVTRKEQNYTLRLHAPLRPTLTFPVSNTQIILPILTQIAAGRIVVAGSDYTNPALRMRLHIIYSNL